MGRSFYLYQRKNSFFYAEIFSPDGKRLFSRSTGTKIRDDAAVIAAGWVRDGIPGKSGAKVSIPVASSSRDIVESVRSTTLTSEDAEAIVRNLQERKLIFGSFAKSGAASVLFLDFLHEAWDSKKSEFLREKAKYGHAITKRHIVESAGIVARYWDRPAFRNLLLIQLDRQMLKKHLMDLIDEGLSPQTANKAFAAVSAPINWAYKEGSLPSNPVEGVPRFTQEGRRRDILTEGEISALIAYHWPDERARIGFVTSLTTGIRLNELMALQVKDLGTDRLFIRHSWSYADKLTTTKNKEARTLPALPEVLAGLSQIAAADPHKKGDEAFIFAGAKPNQPLDGKVLTSAFYEALVAVGIDETTRKARNIVWHSLRHNYATAMTSRLSEAVAAKGTGHKTVDVLREYSDHETEENIRQLAGAAKKAFGKIVQFRKAAGE